MKPLLGIARAADAAHTENDSSCLRIAKSKFPSSFTTVNDVILKGLAISGHFQQYAGAGSTLLLYGEIYNAAEIARLAGTTLVDNHAQLIHSLIAAKGVEAIKSINGQFVILYYNEGQNKLQIINDHMGVQQLLYHYNNGMLLFGSEVKFLYTHPDCPKGIDWAIALKRPQPNIAVSAYKDYATWFNGIYLLPEASIMEIDLADGSMSIRQYWSPKHITPSANDNRTVAQVMDEYATLLDDAVKIRMEHEGTTHSLLSGGLDSSAICGLAVKHGALETYSIINQTTVLEGTTSFCDTMSKEMNFKNKQFLVPYKEMCFNALLWKQRVWRAESPVNHTDSLTKTMLHYAIKKNMPSVTALLTGTGSDQLNGGLVHYVIPDSGDVESNWDNFCEALIEVENAAMISRKDEVLWQMRKFANRDYLSDMAGVPIEPNPWQIYMDGAIHSEAYSLLWDEQRASSSHNHITRYPFLDYRIAEFTAAIPQHLHKHLFYDKQILRVPAKKFLPEYIINKPKKPYELPEYDFRCELFEYLTQDNEQSLFIAAFGDIDTTHPAIDKKYLYSRIQAMREKPIIIEWLNIMHIINLGLLEQLADKDENVLNYEAALNIPPLVPFDDQNAAISFLQKRLGIMTTDELIDRPLKFGENSSLLLDIKNNKYYLSRKNNLTYELDDENKDWKQFLMNIDNVSSTRQVLEKTGITYPAIEEFFTLSLKEQILVINDKPTGY